MKEQTKKELSKGRGKFKATGEDENDVDQCDWVQCDTCSKWRKLAPGAPAWPSGKSFECQMNSWNLSKATCEAQDDEEEEEELQERLTRQRQDLEQGQEQGQRLGQEDLLQKRKRQRWAKRESGSPVCKRLV
jgi:hypothetical protein